MARPSTEQRPAARGDRRLSHTPSRPESVPGAAGADLARAGPHRRGPQRARRAFWLDDTGRAAWNDVIVGAIVFVLGIIAGSERGDRTATIDDPVGRT